MSTVFVDVDTQRDFVCPAGALYAPGAEQIVSVVGKMAKHAETHGIKLISTVDAHPENDAEFRIWRPHCVVGTAGQQKIDGSVLPGSYSLKNSGAARDGNALTTATQLLVEKQDIDCFTNPRLEAVLNQLQVRCAFVYGVVTEVCVKLAAIGLLQRGIEVAVVTDAVQPFSDVEGERALRDLVARGAKLVSAAEAMSAPR